MRRFPANEFASPKIIGRNKAMTISCAPFYTAVVLGAFAFGATSAQALTMKECSAKYKEAQTAGTLKGTSWNDFRKAECGPTAAAAPAAAPSTAATTGAAPTNTAAARPAAPPAPPPSPAPTPAPPPTTTAPPRPAAPAPAAMGNAVFPAAVSPKYTQESQGKARMHTCLDQYNANKASNANGGMKWIQKGGGYYSECNKRLRG